LGPDSADEGLVVDVVWSELGGLAGPEEPDAAVLCDSD